MFYVLKGFVIEGVQCCLFILILQKSKIVRVYVGVLSFLKVQKSMTTCAIVMVYVKSGVLLR